jgi:UTP--glucose-1-phosphate uridylyltransferase
MSKITKAVIAVAGTGTRFLPATKSMPKEMLPIVDKPIIHLVVEELAAAGITDIIFVTNADKKSLEDHFDHNRMLEHSLEKVGKAKYRDQISKIADMCNYVFIRQKGPYGNGTPVLSASNIVGNTPFIYVWGDDLVKSEISFTAQMIKEYEKNNHLMIGVQKVPLDEVDKYGIVKLRENSMEIIDIIEKPSIDEAPSQLADFGRMILDRDIIDILQNTPLGKGDELWIVDAIRLYIKKGGVFIAKEVEGGEWLTTGDPLNYLKAVIKYALEREDIAKDLRSFIQSINLCG